MRIWSRQAAIRFSPGNIGLICVKAAVARCHWPGRDGRRSDFAKAGQIGAAQDRRRGYAVKSGLVPPIPGAALVTDVMALSVR
jgi:hypothetical protein